jgi:hypothetical protein
MAKGQRIKQGFALQDSDWVNGIAEGQNGSVKTLTAHAGGGQSAGTQIPADAMMINVGTVATDHDSCVLPFAIAGSFKILNNLGGHILDLYGQVALNQLTGVIDTINGTAGSTAYSGITATTGKNALIWCSANGAWNVGLLT